jgi:hypothetical protein
MSSKYSLKRNEDDARERLRAFWHGQSLGRPALYVTAANRDYEPRSWSDPEPDLKARDLSPEWQLVEALNCLEQTVCLAEAMPGFVVRFGNWIPLLAVLMGGQYEYHDDEAWIEPMEDCLDSPLPAFDKEHPIVQGLTKVIRHLADTIGDRAIISPVPWMDGITLLASFRTHSRFCMDLIDVPEKIKRWTAAATRVLIAGYGYFYEELKSLGYEEPLSWLNVMAEGKMEPVQCDASIMLSPAMFEEFVMPDLRRLTEYLDFSLYHLDGSGAMRFIDQLSSLAKLNAIQYNPEPGNSGYPLSFIDDFREIRSRNLSLYVNCCTVEQALQLTKELGPDGLFIVLPSFESEIEAQYAIERITKAC